MKKIFQNLLAKFRFSVVKQSPYNEFDLFSRVDGIEFTSEINPGIRVQPNYIDEIEAAEILDCANKLKAEFDPTLNSEVIPL